MRRRQRGQAIVLIAIMVAVLVGMAALAIDGSRAYTLRRNLQSAVDAAALAAASLPASVLKNPGTTCPAPTDGNAYHNPPYASGAYPPSANVAWLYICYANTPGLDFAVPATNQSQQDLNVILLYSYGPLTPLVTAQFGIFRLAVSVHMTVQGT